MMSSWIYFKPRIGQRVRMTDHALKQGLAGRAKRMRNGEVRGTVVRYDGKLRLWVRRDGIKTVSSYFVGFWESVKR